VDALDISRVAAYPAVGAAGAVVGIAVELVPGEGRIRSFYRVNIMAFFKPVICQFLKVMKVNSTVTIEIAVRFILFEASGPIEPDVIEKDSTGTEVVIFGIGFIKTD